MAKYCLGLILILFLIGCGIKPQPQSSESAYLLLKTPMIRMADFAFIKQHTNYTRLHVLNAGQVALDVRLGEDLCFNGPCYERTQFNQRFFGRMHYPTILDDILSAKPIYNGKASIETEDGFTQTIVIEGSNINYEVSDGVVRFEDREHNIKIVIQFKKGVK